MSVLIRMLLEQYPDPFKTYILAVTEPKRDKLYSTDKFIENEGDRYIDYYILLWILYYHNDLDRLEDLEKNMVEHDLIYWYGSDEEADKRAYQLEHFKEVYNVK